LQGLFRQEVVDARRGDWLGGIVIAAPLSRWLSTTISLAMAASILTLLIFGQCTCRRPSSFE